MADYWQSLPKHYCKFCDCWIADNKPSRDIHERGKRHQDNVKQKITEVKKKSLADKKANDFENDALKRMEQKALQALKADVMKNPNVATQYGLELKHKVTPVVKTAAAVEPIASTSSSSQASAEQTYDVAGSSDQWQEAWTPEGFVYYWNSSSGEVTWEKPAGYVASWEKPAETVANEEDSVNAEMPPVYDAAERISEAEASFYAEDSSSSQPASSVSPSPAAVEKEEMKELQQQQQQVADVVLPQDIPLPTQLPSSPPPPTEPCDIPLSGQQPASEEAAVKAEDEETLMKNNEGAETSVIASSTATVASSRPNIERRPPPAYGAWTTVVTEEKQPMPDLQLPVTASQTVTKVIPVSEPKIKFREKTVTKPLGPGEFVPFKKRKMAAAQIRQNHADDFH